MTDTLVGRNQIFSLSEMANILMDRERVPVGFLVSTALHNALCQRFAVENGGLTPSFPAEFHGIKIEVDPSLPETEFEVAFSQSAWDRRLSAVRSRAAVLDSERGSTQKESSE